MGLDDPALSTGLDRKDLDRVFMETATDLLNSPFYLSQRASRGQSTVAILPLVNDTSEHLEPSLAILLSRFEEQLVHGGVLAVVSDERRGELLENIDMQSSDVFDPRVAAEFGRQLGAHYLVTGKVMDIAERTSAMRRVQYALFMQVLRVETGRIVWSRSSDLTKAYVAGP